MHDNGVVHIPLEPRHPKAIWHGHHAPLPSTLVHRWARRARGAMCQNEGLMPVSHSCQPATLTPVDSSCQSLTVASRQLSCQSTAHASLSQLTVSNRPHRTLGTTETRSSLPRRRCGAASYRLAGAAARGAASCRLPHTCMRCSLIQPPSYMLVLIRAGLPRLTRVTGTRVGPGVRTAS